MGKTVKVLMLGDIIGDPGMRAMTVGLKQLIREYSADLTVANGENADRGFGLSESLAEQLFASGVDVITTGNHVWQNRDFFDYMERRNEVLRPANYPKGVPGKGFSVIQKKGIRWGVMNLIGRVDLSNTDCPFKTAKSLIQQNKKNYDYLLVDFHAENGEEKESLAWYLDGDASLVCGTHTHVQTADERIFPKGCGYLTDLGMVGPGNSVIGGEVALSIERMMTQMPLKIMIEQGEAVLQGIFAEIDTETRSTVKLERISKPFQF